MSSKLYTVAVAFPTWDQFTTRSEELLIVLDGESAEFRRLQTQSLELPDAFTMDCLALARRLGHGWTLGRVISYLAVQGAVKVIRDARATREN
jgi:hypothetical protein